MILMQNMRDWEADAKDPGTKISMTRMLMLMIQVKSA
jgi:hypothetical protein